MMNLVVGSVLVAGITVNLVRFSPIAVFPNVFIDTGPFPGTAVLHVSPSCFPGNVCT